MSPLTVGLASGVAGWVLENAANQRPRYSKMFGGARVPFLPVYAVGGAFVALSAPHLEGLSLPARAATYGLGLTVLEGVAGALDRAASGPPSWDYDGAVVDARHAALWAILGVGLEALVLPSSSG